MSTFPDYYALLNIPKTASYDEIRTAYKKESLKYIYFCLCFCPQTYDRGGRTHPDRLTKATVAERKQATEKFQVFDQLCLKCVTALVLIVSIKAVADAYYVLSDKTRRREYDALYASRSKSDRTSDPTSSSNFFTNFAYMFASAAAGGAAPSGTSVPAEGDQPNAEGVFADVFDDVCSHCVLNETMH